MSKINRILTPLSQRLGQKMGPQYSKVRAQALQRWQRLQPREQKMLRAMAVVIAIAILWFGIWQPLQEREMRAEAALAGQYSTQRYVETQISQVLQARANRQQGTAAVNSAQLNGLLSTLSNELELEVARMQPQNESLLVVFNEVDFNRLIQLLVRLTERQVVIEAIDISETNEPGVVRVRRLLIRA
ncbi:type II secretory pathway, component PulM [Idiomarina sp. A28L]|uniref:type II secretion system protein GspM n=1 Tax=Idiomarina sp. A28L TaxID=1036674 RepID=UPI0002138DFF|nr:type II secretion system protein M [Idiomarina sp. A28L]EGN74713.1 type II secretory pathway, component PulM [Idiomarina sp. A28L]